MGPLNHLLAQHDKDIRMLEQQKGISEDWDRLAERLELAMSRYAGSLDELDAGSLQRLMRLLNIRLTREPDGEVVTGILDPTLFTIGRTWA